jgi:outer membrane protein
MNIELLERNRLQVESVRQQYRREQKLVELGAANRVRMYQLKAQLANEELGVVTSQNQLDQSYLSLWQLMNIEPDTSLKIERPAIAAQDIADEARSIQEVYHEYEGHSPEVKAAQFRTTSSALSRKIAVGSRSPRLTANAGIQSFYSTQTTRGTGIPTLTPTPLGVDGNGNPILIMRQTYPGTEVTPFSEQFDRNLGKTLGFTLFVPIFNGWQVNTSLQKARINEATAQLNQKQVQNDLFKTIAQAHQDLRAARKKYEATENSFEANREALALAEAQFAAGALSTTDYLNSKNEFLKAQATFVQAKYELVFRRKALDFYLGKPIY